MPTFFEVTARPAYVADHRLMVGPRSSTAKNFTAWAPAPAASDPSTARLELQLAAGAGAPPGQLLHRHQGLASPPAGQCRILVGAVAVLLLAGLFAVGIVIGRKTNTTATECAPADQWVGCAQRPHVVPRRSH